MTTTNDHIILINDTHTHKTITNIAFVLEVTLSLVTETNSLKCVEYNENKVTQNKICSNYIKVAITLKQCNPPNYALYILSNKMSMSVFRSRDVDIQKIILSMPKN